MIGLQLVAGHERYAPPVQLKGRIAADDTTIGDIAVALSAVSVTV
jgi:hypothetical protein